MVQTRAAAKRIESGLDPYTAAVVSSPTKKRRVDGTDPPRKRHRGKQRELCQLNLDVLFLLAAYVHPLDLLNLARTCRSLRELLMDKASSFIWKTARNQACGLPDCPADLTEPEYANLVFYARCHGCGKYAKKMLWALRRRYCPDCRKERLCGLSSCPDIIRNYYILPKESLVIDGEKGSWIDKEQLQSAILEYERCTDKEQFLKEKREQYYAIYWHARKCQEWEWDAASKRKYDLDVRRQERSKSIFERLKQQGYGPEIAYFGDYEIEQSRKSFFKTSKPLTDKEWALMWPEWLETMNNFRAERREVTVYRKRRELLATEYADYLASPVSSPSSGLLPHATDLAWFPPFRDIIYAPEEAHMGNHPFESAFAQLPALAEDWREPLETELANLIQIPAQLSSKTASSDLVLSSGSATVTEPPVSASDKLRLACAVFDTGDHDHTVCRYPEVFSTSVRRRTMNHARDDPKTTVSFRDRFGIKFVEDAAYIVHACGLDPNVATVEDMDRRNARLICATCETPRVRNWRNAIFHVLRFRHYGQNRTTACSASPSWRLVGDEHIDAIQAAELTGKKETNSSYMRCLLCQPSVGDARLQCEIRDHLVQHHGVERDIILPGEHYAYMSMEEPGSLVEMIEADGQVIFRQLWGI